MRNVRDLIQAFSAGKFSPGTRVVLRADLNVPLDDTGGAVRDDNRIRAVLPTIRALREAGASIVLCSHLGRPKGVDPGLSLRPVADHLGRLLDSSVRLLGQATDGSVGNAVSGLKPGEVVLLENLRFDPGEKKNEPALARALASLGEAYVNDAFGTCHRAHASVVGVPRHLPAFAGFLVEKELGVVTRLRERPERPFWIILGGAKVADKIGVVMNLREQVDGFLVGGGMANTFLAGLGESVGASRVEEDAMGELEKLVKGDGPEWVFPEDFVAGDTPRGPGTVKSVSRGEDPGSLSFFDIGPRSRQSFIDRLRAARTVFWNGPLGVFEEPAFAEGTHEVARALADMDGERIIGGGDTAAAVRHFGVADAMTHVSTGGGASLEFLEGRVLPGLKALDDAQEFEDA